MKTRDQNRALRLVLNKDSRHNVWELHHEALIPFLDKRRDCHLANMAFKRSQIAKYIQTPNRQLRMYEAPVFIEHQSQNATFERSILYKGAKVWNQLTVDERNINCYEKFKLNRKQLMLSNIG